MYREQTMHTDVTMGKLLHFPTERLSPRQAAAEDHASEEEPSLVGRITANDDRHFDEIAGAIDGQPVLTAWLADRVKDVSGTPLSARLIAVCLTETFEHVPCVEEVSEADIKALEFVLHCSDDLSVGRDRVRRLVEVFMPKIVDKLVVLGVRLGWDNPSDLTNEPAADMRQSTDLRQMEHLGTFFMAACALLLKVDFRSTEAA